MSEELEFTMIMPHGGTLIDCVLRGDERTAARARAASLAQIPLSAMGTADLEMLATGALSPLNGFMGEADYKRVILEMRLANGLVWTIPVTLPVDEETAQSLKLHQEVALAEAGRPLALMTIDEIYPYAKELEAAEVYRTVEEAHPGVRRLMGQGGYYLAGKVRLFDWPKATETEFPEFRHTPAQTRRIFPRRGWRRIVAFQTRNPIHRAHEYIQKTALEIVDGLFLHPLVGETKSDDIPADVRMASYQELLRDYYPPDRVILGVFPAAMRYAGPREAVFHALCRKNYGCTHFIVGRDHAGVGKYYGTYDAHRIFENFTPDEIGIITLFFDHTFYCRKCGGIVSSKTCPHDPSYHVVLSGSQVRQMLETGEDLPVEFTRPEVARVLSEGMQKKKAAQE